MSSGRRTGPAEAPQHEGIGEPTDRAALGRFVMRTKEYLGIIRVRDEGTGFDPESIPDPLAPENVLKSSGRGIFLIRNFMDETVLKKVAGGMEIRMVKKLQRAGA